MRPQLRFLVADRANCLSNESRANLLAQVRLPESFAKHSHQVSGRAARRDLAEPARSA